MPIVEDIDTFIHNYTLNTIKNYKNKKNIQLWQFAIRCGNSENYFKEKKEIEKGQLSFWSKPDTFNKYENKKNILIVTDKEYSDIYIISSYNENINRPWWDNNHFKNGIIKLNIIGKLNSGEKDVASYCNYKQFSICNKFQPIKKVTFSKFIDNIN